MNISTLLFGIIVLFFLWRGYEKGFIGSIARLSGWLIAYPAAMLLTKPVSNLISSHSKLDGLIVYFIAGGSIFLLVSFTAAQLFKLFTRSHKEKNRHSTRSRIGGAVIGVCVGGFVGLLVGYAILLVQKPAAVVSQHEQPRAEISTGELKKSAVIDAYTNRLDNTHSTPRPSLVETSAKKLAGTLASTAVDVVLDDPTTAQIARSFAENPQETLGNINEIANNGEMNALFADADAQEALNTGDIDKLLANEKFKDMMNNEQMQGLLGNIRDENTGKTSPKLAAETMIMAWQRMDAMKKDPRVEAILADPEFRDQVTSSDKIGLLVNPKLKELTEILLSKPDAKQQDTDMVSEDTATEEMGTQNLPDKPAMADDINALQETLANESNAAGNTPDIETEKPIYRWVDEHGRVHFSDHEKGSDGTSNMQDSRQ